MSISYEGIGQVLATFQVERGTEVGAVVMTKNNTVGMGEMGACPCGVLIHKEEDNMGAVQLEGMVEVTFSGHAPTVGYAAFICDGYGNLLQDDNGRQLLVVSVDEENETMVIKL